MHKKKHEIGNEKPWALGIKRKKKKRNGAKTTTQKKLIAPVWFHVSGNLFSLLDCDSCIARRNRERTENCPLRALQWFKWTWRKERRASQSTGYDHHCQIERSEIAVVILLVSRGWPTTKYSIQTAAWENRSLDRANGFLWFLFPFLGVSHQRECEKEWKVLYMENYCQPVK